MFKIFDTKYKDKVGRALKIINDYNMDLTYLQKTCLCKLYLENDIGKKIEISPEYFGLNKTAYLKLVDKLFFQELAEINKKKSLLYEGTNNLIHVVTLKEV